MEPNPGGRLALSDIVGRLKEIEIYWRILNRQSLVLGAERRLGKTHIVWKMHAEGRSGFVTFYQDLEGTHSILELVHEIYRAIGPKLSTIGKIKAGAITAWHTLLPKRFGNLELPEAKNNWKILFRTAIEDVLEVVPDSEKVVLIWDELPLMLHNIQRHEGSSAAIELLDVLRHLRQIHGGRLRFIFTGSIGLHLVIRALRADGNANDPINDMQIELLPPMRENEGLELSHRILESTSPRPSDIPAVAKRMVDRVGGYPYFLHHVGDKLSRLESPAVPVDVDNAVTALIEDPADSANLAYFRSRIDTYYLPAEVPIALAVLDGLAASEAAIDFDTLVNLARHRCPEITEENARTSLLLLRQDHYIQLVDSRYDFRWVVLKQWWKRNRI